MRHIRTGAGVLIASGALLLAAPLSVGAASATTLQVAKSSAPQSKATITISNFMFNPMTTKVKPGAKITVTNKDSVTHTLSGTKGAHFNTGNISSHKSKSFTAPTKPGTYHYICNIHQYMTGTITVS
jgi:plastocyanin